MEEEFVNLTEYVIVFYFPDGKTVEIQPSGTVAKLRRNLRLIMSLATIDVEHRVPVFYVRETLIENLPAERWEGLWYITSIDVAEAATRQGRGDVFGVDTTIRDELGRVWCAALVKFY